MLFNYSVLMPTTDIPAAVDTFARDTVEAAAMLRQMGVQKVALVGGSVGGLSALRAGLDAEARADGIVCLSGSGSTEVTDSLRRRHERQEPQARPCRRRAGVPEQRRLRCPCCPVALRRQLGVGTRHPSSSPVIHHHDC
jgi:pimeloyl-ACP methyl ester carboxylesterase